jgi:hypothetical protein
MRSQIWLLMLCSLAGRATAQQVQRVKSGCDDLGVVGRIRTVGKTLREALIRFRTGAAGIGCKFRSSE